MLARHHREQRIVTQQVMVVEVLLARRQAEHPLSDQRPHLMLDQLRADHP